MEKGNFVATAENSAGRRGNKKSNEFPQSTWLGRDQEGSIWLCYTGPLARRKKVGSQILGDLRFHQSTAAPAWWCGPRPPLGWVEMAFDLPNAPSYPGHFPQKSEFGTDNYYFGESAIRVGDVITTP